VIGKPFERVFWFSMMPNFEIEGRPIERRPLSGFANDLVSLHPLAHLNEKFRSISVQAIIAVSVVDNQEIPVSLKPISIHYLAGFDDAKLRARGGADANALVKGVDVKNGVLDLAIG
jgi:hypothetical protein